MNLLLITTAYPTPARPHQSSFNRVLVQQLRGRHDVRVIAPVPWVQRLRGRGGGRGVRDDAGELYPTYVYPPKLLRHRYGEFFSRSIRGSVDRLLERFRPDAVIGYWAHPDGEAAGEVARRCGVPFVLLVGGSDIRVLTGHARRRECIRRVLRSADRVIAVSGDLAERVRQLGVSPERIELVYRGVDPTIFYFGDRLEARRRVGVGEGDVLITWVGRLVDVKHPEMLVHAAVRWKAEWGQQLRVAMIGEGPLRSKLERLARRSDVDDVCRLLGSRPHRELADWYRAANVTALTSRSEGVPNVLMESIACGTPFVATDVGGVAEIASPRHDRLVAAGDTEGFSRAVIQSVDSPEVTGASDPGIRKFLPEPAERFADRIAGAIASCIDRSRSETLGRS